MRFFFSQKCQIFCYLTKILSNKKCYPTKIRNLVFVKYFYRKEHFFQIVSGHFVMPKKCYQVIHESSHYSHSVWVVLFTVITIFSLCSPYIRIVLEMTFINFTGEWVILEILTAFLNSITSFSFHRFL